MLQSHLPHDEWVLVMAQVLRGLQIIVDLTLLLEVWLHIYSLHSMLCISYEISLISSSIPLSHDVLRFL